MTTRFYDGDPSNNAHCWDGNNPGDPAWRGDFKGLIEKLDYIKAMGFTAVWITPVVDNASGYDYHSYHAINHSKVDDRYNSVDVSFQTLIDAVHSKGMKIILDIVLNHTGNFGEENLCPLFKKEGNPSSISSMKLHPQTKLPANYFSLTGGQQYQARLARMKNTDGTNHDSNNYWHHFGNFNWDDLTSQWAQIAGDCVDLNTENPAVYNYLVNAYTQFINMGVDGFRIDTSKHISRLVFNKVFNNAFLEAARRAGKPDFFMFAEIATRVREVWNRGVPAISTPFYTWKDTKSYNWSDDASPYSQVAVFEGNFMTAANSLINQKACIDNYNDNSSTSNQPTSNNHRLNGNDYHTPDHSLHSGLNVIDFPMHWNFRSAGEAYGVAIGNDHVYNDATYNVVYVDSHDFAPDGAPESQRFAQSQDTWAENLSLMYTFRGIPCVYYGSEIEFKKGKVIDNGHNTPLIETGRAYYGGYIKGSVNVSDFASYSNATGNMSATLKHPLAQHIQRLSKIRMAVPALRKGQYSTDNISSSGVAAFKRRYTDVIVDSYALVTISGSATFNNILNGTYTDVVTGDVKTVTNGSLTANCSGKGNIRVYVLNTNKTSAPGKIGDEGKYIYSSSSVNVSAGSYDGTQEALTTDPDTGGDTGGGDDIEIVQPQLCIGEQAVFFQKPSDWGQNINVYVYDDSSNPVIKIAGSWPGSAMQNLGNGNYKYTFNQTIGAAWKIIFNDGSKQNPGSGKTGWTVTNGAVYKYANIENDAIVQILSETECQSSIKNTRNKTLRIYESENGLYIETEKDIQLDIYTAIGYKIMTVNLVQGSNKIDNLPAGFYVIGNQKVIKRK
ncbi:hypothetical protein MASR2M117_07700 [Paludibacter sp.]